MTIRTFIAFDVDPGPRLRHVIDQLNQIGPSVRISDSPKLHLTLKFLGETHDDTVSEVAHIVDEVVLEFTRIDSAMAGLGVFPDRKKPTVVWVGIQDPRPVVALQQQLERRLEVAGWKPDPRTYRPHVTVARLNARRGPTPGALLELLDRHAATDFGSFHIDQVALYQSELTSQGASHTALHRSAFHEMRLAERSPHQENTTGS